jgi:hypothetical protein
VDRWTLGLEAWVIQDGNYGDFRRGDQLELAVEFSFTDVERADKGHAQRVFDRGEGEYDALGTVVYVDPSLWIVDIGICAYAELLPELRLSAGDPIHGAFALEVDPFMYVERHALSSAVPPLVYTWQLARIRRQAAPFVETAPRYFERDRSQSSWTEVEATDAGNDDGGHATYLLDCVRLPEAPRRRSRTFGG